MLIKFIWLINLLRLTKPKSYRYKINGLLDILVFVASILIKNVLELLL